MTVVTNPEAVQPFRATDKCGGGTPAPPSPPRTISTAGKSVPRVDRDTAEAVNRQSEFQELARHLQQALSAAIPEPCKVCFRWSEEDELFVLEVRSETNGEIIKQYPPEKILNLRRRLDELLGVMIDQQV